MTDFTRFAVCLHSVLAWEGGFDDDPVDPGGATCQGITIAEYCAWHGETLTPANASAMKAALAQMDDGTRDDIYLKSYWNAAHCSELPAGLDLMVFDAAVNNGVGIAIKWLQRALDVPADGHFGVITANAARQADVIATIQAIAKTREAYYRSIKTFWRFGKGWINRLSSITEQAIGTVHGQSGAMLGLVSAPANDAPAPPVKTPKAIVPPETASMPQSTTGWAAVLATVAGVVSLFQQLNALAGELVKAGKSATDLHLSASLAPTQLSLAGLAAAGIMAGAYIWLERHRKGVQG